MKNLIIALFCFSLFGSSCHTFTSANGEKHRQFMPAKESRSIGELDTSKFVKQDFLISDYTNKIAKRNGKKIIVPIEGKDISSFLPLQQRCYVYFWNPVCVGTLPDIRKFDSLSKAGENVVIVSLRKDYTTIDKALHKTSFSQYPYYVIEDEKYTRGLLVRKIMFSKDACPSCYTQYRDDLAIADYLLIENGTIKPVLYNAGSIIRN